MALPLRDGSRYRQASLDGINRLRLVLEEGVFVRPLGQVVYLLPPLCISDEQLERGYGAIGRALDRL